MPSKKRVSTNGAARAKRPKLPRTAPLRGIKTLLDPVGASRANGEQARQAKPAREASDSVQRGVELGYRVIDQYLKQGATAATAFASPKRESAPTGDDLPKMTERMMQYASDFSSMWFDAMGVMLGSANGRAQAAEPVAPNGQEPPKPSEGTAEAAAAGRRRYVLELKSARAVEVTVTLDEAASAALVVEPLQARAKGKAITDVAVTVSETSGPLKVRVHVPAGLPKGRYSGAVLDKATKKPRGRITVLIAAE